VVTVEAVAAALLSRHTSLTRSDVLVLATAGHLKADHLLTTDRNWPRRAKRKLTATITDVSLGPKAWGGGPPPLRTSAVTWPTSRRRPIVAEVGSAGFPEVAR
jgi:hypothetical protein